MRDKKTTRERLRDLVAAEPQLHQSQLATRLGVTPERVRQLLTAEGLTVPRAYPRGGGGTMQARLRTGGAPVRVHATVGGAVGELLAAADLMARGYTLFLPITRIGWCDLVAIGGGGAVERIEVRSGRRGAGETIYWNHPDESRSERRAIVLTGEPVVYDPPFPGDAGAGEDARPFGEVSPCPGRSTKNRGL